MADESDNDFGTSDRIWYGQRHTKVYPVTETELRMLKWSPIWVRIFIVNNLKRQTDFA